MTIAVLIEPLDLLFCRDGRPIIAGEGAAAGTALPSPQVVVGAIRTALLRQRGHLPSDGGRPQQAHLDAVLNVQVRGPLLANLATQSPFIPMPADLIGDKAKHGREGQPRARLAPRQSVPGWVAPADVPHALPLWPPTERAKTTAPQGQRIRAGDQAPQSGFLSWEGFRTWADGKVPTLEHIRQRDDLCTTETRTQVGLDPMSAIAADGMLFTTRYLRLKAGIGLYVEIEAADDLPAAFTLLLGGDRRQASVRRLAKPVAWPTSGNVALALTSTILAADDGRCPIAWKPLCRGFSIPGADPISGWDLAKNDGKGAPRSTRWAIQSGSVWHLKDLSVLPRSIGMETENGFGWLAYGSAPTVP